jgi:prophage regulatory protein
MAEQHKAATTPTVTPGLKKLYRMKELREVVGRCPASIYQDVRAGRFPGPIAIGPNASGWLVSEVEDWLTQRAAARPAAAGISRETAGTAT